MRKLRTCLLAAALGLTFSAVSVPAGDIGEKTLSAAIKAANVKRAEESPAKTLKVYNWEDYILPDMTASEAEDNGYDAAPIDGLNTRYEKYMAETYGLNVNVIYDTFDTNETMLAQLRTGKIDYDLVCPSDYAIQKMMDQNLIIPFDNEEEYPGSTPNYDSYASPFLISKLESIKAYDRYHQGDAAVYEAGQVQNFMRGYMWGTLGLVYNPGFHIYADEGYSAEKVHQDMLSWDILWNPEYKGTAYVKDSVRDTYAVLIIKAYEEEVKTIKDQYSAGEISENEYNSKLTDIFNRCDNETLDRVAATLRDLTDNFYGYEVDNGKDDIQKNTTVGIDLAWSGDAVYAMNSADDSGTGVELYYALPEEGANIWFDGWVMTKYALQHETTFEAQAYVDFLSNPNPESDEYDMGPAVANMDYIGYTPFISSDSVFEYVQGLYDVRADEDGVVADPTLAPEGEEGVDWVAKDVTYFFSHDGSTAGEYVIYQDPSQCGRQLDTMYPNTDQLPFLVVMADFGDQTGQVTQMWEANKALQLPTWAYIVVGVVLAAALAVWGWLAYKHHVVRKRRRERHRANQAKAEAAKGAK